MEPRNKEEKEPTTNEHVKHDLEDVLNDRFSRLEPKDHKDACKEDQQGDKTIIDINTEMPGFERSFNFQVIGNQDFKQFAVIHYHPVPGHQE